jgi:diaminopimelate decarboxylase
MSHLDDLITRFGVRDGQLTVGGHQVEALAQRAGGTPFFAYDRMALQARVVKLREELPADLQLSYAVKANPMPAVVQYLANMVDRFDVASAAEMRVALDSVLPATHISFAGPGKTDLELCSAIASGVTIEMESVGELRRIVRVGERLGIQPRVAVRINPDFAVKGSGMRMGGGAQQFGVDAEQVPGVLSLMGEMDVHFRGFHLFAGSQNLNAESLIAAQRETIGLIADLAALAPSPVQYVNVGGGFGIPYFDSERPLDLKSVGDALGISIDSGRERGLDDATFVVELGRYIVGESGVYVTRVVDRKISRGRIFLVVDGGLHHQLAASGNFGQVIRRNYPIVVGTKMGRHPMDEPVDIVGCSCTPLDRLGGAMYLPEAEVGDLIVVFQAGAYGLTASPINFLSHPQAVEMVV